MAKKTPAKHKPKPKAKAKSAPAKPKKKVAAPAVRAPAPPKPRKKPKAFTIKPRSEMMKKKEEAKDGAAKPASRSGRRPALQWEQGAAGKKLGKSVAEVASTIAADSKGYVFVNGRRVRMISIKPGSAPKKSRSSAAKLAAAAETVIPKNIKTKLSKKELDHYRELLLTKRRQLSGDISAMELQALRSDDGNVSHMPIHMADLGTDTHDQDLLLGLAEKENRQIREIDEALMRIQNHTFGVCLHSFKPIPKARLDAKPWAKYTIEAARQLETDAGE
ncbi:MAG TPA: hypothetical protein VG711_07120 [Phycisphaerales bacterium]|nr:hypothetical protein [Phycisphaerales bacterium]